MCSLWFPEIFGCGHAALGPLWFPENALWLRLESQQPNCVRYVQEFPLRPAFSFPLFPYFICAASALAAALMIATEVIVAPLVASIPLKPCFSTIFRVVSSIDE